MKIKISSKHLQIDKSQSRILAIIAVSTVIVAFCLVSSWSLLRHAAYQRKVLNETNEAKSRIEDNLKAANDLIKQYETSFLGDGPTNVIGGRNTDGENAHPPDGTNAKIVLNALPTTYDFPALVTSVASILSGAGVGSPNITGTDQSSEVSSAPSNSPQPVPVNISVSGSASYANAHKLVKDFERSIRPFDVTNFSLSGSDSDIQISLTMNTYFQPAKSLSIDSKEVK